MPVSDQKEQAEDMSGKEAQKSAAEQAWEKALTAITQAREACLQTLLTLQTLKESLEGRAGQVKEEDIEALCEEVTADSVRQCDAFQEACQAFHVHYLYERAGADTEPPQGSEEATGTGYCHYCGEYHKDPLSGPEAAALIESETVQAERAAETDENRLGCHQSFARHSN